MIPHYTKIHNNFTLEGNHYGSEELNEIAYSFIKEGLPYEKEIGLFLLDWLDDSDTIIVQTSGTTSEPKRIRIKKQAMVKSAIATGNFFNLQPGNSALHCLPANYIAGKMMLVRALVIGLVLEIVSPKGNPLAQKTKTYDFAAMVPMQVEKAMPQLHQIKTLIVGGAKLSNTIITQLKKQNANVYETYGMTETITHIAARPINEAYFKALPNVSFTLDDRECLVIHAPKLINETITTNDRVTLVNENTFEWLGRIDNVINSGGVKLFPERIEEKLQNKISTRFFIASEPNEVFGNQVVLVVETTENKLDTSIFNELDSYEKPKKIYTIPKFIETATGKIQRNKTLEKLNIKSL